MITEIEDAFLDEISKQDSEMESLKERIKELEDENIRAITCFHERRSEVESLKQNEYELNKEINELKNAISKKDCEIEHLKESNEKLEEEKIRETRFLQSCSRDKDAKIKSLKESNELLLGKQSVRYNDLWHLSECMKQMRKLLKKNNIEYHYEI
jgi:predicted nuclease with TOPRIM domain